MSTPVRSVLAVDQQQLNVSPGSLKTVQLKESPQISKADLGSCAFGSFFPTYLVSGLRGERQAPEGTMSDRR